MKKYVLSENQYIKLRNVLLETSLRTYIFDWDDNILYMPTTIKMDKKEGGKWVPVDVPTDEYAHIRTSPEYRLRDNSPGIAFSDFRESKPFIEDIKKAIHNNNFASSDNNFASLRAPWTSLSDMSILYFRHKESKLTDCPINFFLANIDKLFFNQKI